MAQRGVINEVADVKAVQAQLTAVDTSLTKTRGELMDTLEAAGRLNSILGGSKSIKDYNKNISDAAIANERLAQQIQKTAAEEQKRLIVEQNLAKAIAQREAAEARAAATTDRQTQASQKQTAAAERAAQAYNVLNAAYQEATTLARNVGAQYGETSKQFQDAAKSANFLRERLDAIDRPLGNHQRNVGNYRSAFDGLGNSINQLSRELPAFAVSAQTGILALSNNIPIFFDQIQRTRLEVAALRAEGQQTPGVFSRIISSLFSWGTALSLGVTLLTIYGKEVGNFVKSLFKGTEALDLFAERQKTLNDVYKSSNADIATQTTQLKYLYASATDVNNAMDERLQSAKKLQKEYPKTFGLQEKENIINGEAIDVYNKLTNEIIINARAKAAAAKIAEESAKILDAQMVMARVGFGNQQVNEQTRKDLEQRIRGALSYEFKRRGIVMDAQKFDEGVQKELERQYKVSNDKAAKQLQEQFAIVKRAENNIKFIERFIGGGTAIGNGLNEDPTKKDKKAPATPQDNTYSQYLQQQKEILERNLEDERATFEQRETAIDAFEGSSKVLLEKGLKAKEFTQLEYNTRIYGVENEAAKKRLSLYEAEYNQQIAMAREKDGKLIDDQKTATQERIRLINANSQTALSALSEQLAKGVITEQEYTGQREQIERQSSDDIIQAQIDGIKELIEWKKKSGADIAADTKTLADLELKQIEVSEVRKLAAAKDGAKARRDLLKAEFDFLKDLVSAASSIVSSVYEAEKQNLQERSDAVTKDAENRKAVLDNELIGDQEREEKKKIIDAQAQSKREAIDKQQKKLQYDAAKANKAFAILNVAIATAEAIGKIKLQAAVLAANPLTLAYVPVALAQIPFAIASGALQLAAIAAQPLPKYAVGTDDHKGGLAWVGERGKEGVILPTGETFETPGTATLMNLPKHTQVINNREYMAMKHSVPTYMQNQLDLSELIAETRRSTTAITGALKTKQRRIGIVRNNTEQESYARGIKS